MKHTLILLLLLLTLCACSDPREQPRDSLDLTGAWVLRHVEFPSGTEQDYAPDGEYACAEIAMTKDGVVAVMPHEYGTYIFKNGVYSEMGRPAVRPSDMVLTDKTHFRGRWKNRNDSWVKHPQMPDKVVRYIVDRCKTKETPSDVQQLIKQSMFK